MKTRHLPLLLGWVVLFAVIMLLLPSLTHAQSLSSISARLVPRARSA